MCSHEDIMKKIESRPMADYVKQTKMDRLGTWGTETEILAFATMTNTVVYVYCRSSMDKTVWLPYKPLTTTGGSEKAIYLNNESGNHFEPVLDVE